MASNVNVKITADVVDLTAKFAVAKAESAALQNELRTLARQATAAGGEMSGELKASLQSVAAAAAKARAEAALLGSSLKTAQEGTGTFTASLQGIRGGLASLGIAVSVGLVKQLGESVLETAAHMEHQAQVLQITSRNYQAYIQAAQDSGVASEDVDTALQRFSKSAAEAAVGTGVAAKTFVEMGISANQSKDALLQQVSAYALHASVQERDRIATELFSRSGAEMIPLFDKWSEGVDNLATKYDAMGRIIDPQTTEKAEQALIHMRNLGTQLEVMAAGPVADLAEGFLKLLKPATDLPSNADAWTKWSTRLMVGFQAAAAPAEFLLKELGLLKNSAPEGGAPAPKPTNKPVALVAPTEKDEVNALDAIDHKMRERTDLEKELAIAVKTRADAQKAGDTAGYAKASEAVSDLKKQLDSLNHVAADPSIKKAAEAARAALRKLEEEARQVREELDAEARADAARDVSLAKLKLDAVKQALDEEYAAHQITAQQKYDATIAALSAEAAAERAALQEEIDSDVTTVAQKHAAMDQIVVLDAEMNLKIAEAHRQLTAELHREDEKRLEDNRQMLAQIDQAESSLVSDILTKRQSLTLDLEQIGAKFLETEIQDDLKMLTERAEVNAGLLASDKATAQGGLLWKLATSTQETAAVTGGQATQTAAVAAGSASRTATQAAAATASKSIQATANASEISGDAAKAGAGAYAALVGIPLIGPIIAPIAAGVAFAAVEAFGSFDKGVNVVPHDMVAQIHAGERIVPAADNRALIGALNGSGDGGTKNGETHLHYNPTINAPGAKSLSRMLDEEASTMRNWLASQKRDGYI